MKYIILIGFMILLLSGCNSNINDALDDFCKSKGFKDTNYIKDYNYKNTMIECISTSYLGFHTDKKEMFNISCIYDTECLGVDKWGDCLKKDYNYTCG